VQNRQPDDFFSLEADNNVIVGQLATGLVKAGDFASMARMASGS
jgi:hypothetical protein